MPLPFKMSRSTSVNAFQTTMLNCVRYDNPSNGHNEKANVKQSFITPGNVVRANVKEDDNQKSKGYGTVQFETPLEALNAVCILVRL